MTRGITAQAESLKQHLQEQISIALQWVESGSVREDSTFEDGDGHLPFQGCLERLTERTNEMALLGERWESETLALWCKQEADVWFDGFPDDTQKNRADFTASLYSLAKRQLGLSEEALTQARH
jgi:hypothetical protein